MSDHVTASSDLNLLPTARPPSPHAPSLTPPPLAICHSSPPKPTTPLSDDSYFTVEELSDDESNSSSGIQVLHPYELEEVESVGDVATATLGDTELVEDDSDHIQPSDLGASPCLGNIISGSGHIFASHSPTRSNPRKRSLSEASDADTESHHISGAQALSEPPRLRRRIFGPEHFPSMGHAPILDETSSPQAAPAWVTDDPMDIDGQAV